MANSLSSKSTICVVAILRNEQNFLDEWLVYHRMLGIDHFFLYDDSPQLPLTEFIEPHKAFVTVIPWYQRAIKAEKRECNRQIDAYKHAVEEFAKPFEWVTFIDVDEFIVLRKHNSILGLLNEFKDCGALSLNWHVFGHNGFYTNPKGIITASLLRREKKASKRFKSITRTKIIEDILSVHHCKITQGWKRASGDKSELYPAFDKIAHINHYQSRSFENWMERSERGFVRDDNEVVVKGDKWRTNYHGCLEKFVKKVALNKNEYVDTFMLKYSFNIVKTINSIVRKPKLFDTQDSDNLENKIQSLIRSISLTISKESGNTFNQESIKQRISILIFSYYSFKFFKPSRPAMASKIFVKRTLKALNDLTLLRPREDLLYEGIAIELLVQSCFLKVNTGKQLKSLDKILHTKFSKKDDAIISELDKSLYSSYLYLRQKNTFNPENHPLNENLYNHHNLVIPTGISDFDDLNVTLKQLQRLTDTLAIEDDAELKGLFFQQINEIEIRVLKTWQSSKSFQATHLKFFCQLFSTSRKLKAPELLQHIDSHMQKIKEIVGKTTIDDNTLSIESQILIWIICRENFEAFPNLANRKMALHQLQRVLLRTEKLLFTTSQNDSGNADSKAAMIRQELGLSGLALILSLNNLSSDLIDFILFFLD